MLNFFVEVLIKIGDFVVQTGNIGCFWLFGLDEPECPKSLID
jgi:hypothetical protein